MTIWPLFEKATAVAKGLKIELMKSWELGHVITAIFEETVEHMLLQPTFITEYPAAVSRWPVATTRT